MITQEHEVIMKFLHKLSSTISQVVSISEYSTAYTSS